MTVASVSIARPLPQIADELGQSFAEYGFAVIRDHGIPQALIERAQTLAKAFFELPEEAKRAYHTAGGAGARSARPYPAGRPRRSPRRGMDL